MPFPGLEHRLVFKDGAVQAIKKVKGWKTDADMARALGLTKQYINMMKKGRVGVTSTVITRLAVVMGSITANWWVFYEILPNGIADPDHPAWNYDKYLGRQPYKSRFGEDCHFRGKTGVRTEARDERF